MLTGKGLNQSFWKEKTKSTLDVYKKYIRCMNISVKRMWVAVDETILLRIKVSNRHNCKAKWMKWW